MGRLRMSKSNQELEWVERLAKTLAGHQLHELEFETEDVCLTLRAKRKVPVAPAVAVQAADLGEHHDVEEADITLIRSKDVGLFRPAKGLATGAEISVGQKIGIVEAVSVEHDLVADQAGTLMELLVSDGDPVEYGQPLLVLSESEG